MGVIRNVMVIEIDGSGKNPAATINSSPRDPASGEESLYTLEDKT